MSANLSPEYSEAERKYKASASDEERLAALQEMLSTIPKHKGTEKMQADIKTRISRLKKDLQGPKGKAKRQDPSHVRREGAGQVVLVGAPNAGKSALVAAVTNATPEVADYPFTTQKPQPAMMAFENIQIQLVDAPAVSREFTPGWLPNLVRNTDLALLVADAGNDACLENVEAVVAVLEERHVRLTAEPEAEARVLARTVEIPTLLVVNKMDRDGAAERLEILSEFFGDRFEMLPLSIHDDDALRGLRARVFAALDVIRVVSKAPGKEPESNKPFVLSTGSTVTDFARAVHKDLAEQMRFARLWGEGKFDGQRVPRDHELCDMDIVEINV